MHGWRNQISSIFDSVDTGYSETPKIPQNCCIKTTHRRMYWQRASTQDGQAPGDTTVLKRVFRDNFVIFHHRSKRIEFFGISEFFCTDAIPVMQSCQRTYGVTNWLYCGLKLCNQRASNYPQQCLSLSPF